MTRGPLPHPSGSLLDLPNNVWFIGQESAATQRQGRYSPASVRGHSAKLRPELARRLIDAYTQPGDWILDPLSGIGTVGVEAVHRSRHYVGIELETRFVAWQQANLQQARAQGAAGRFAVLQADARRLDSRWKRGPSGLAAVVSEGPVDAVITSPPYGDWLSDRSRRPPSPFVRRLMEEGRGESTFVPGWYGPGPANIGNLTGAAYWTAMRHVYAGCYEVLRPGGRLVIVLRPGRNGPRLQPLHHETARCCTSLGFTFLDEIVAVQGRVAAVPSEPARLIAHAHYWRRRAVSLCRDQGWPVTLNQVEYALVFQKLAPARAGPLPAPPRILTVPWRRPQGARRAVAAAR